MYDEKPGEARRAFRLHGGEAAACLTGEKKARENAKLGLAPKSVSAAAKSPSAKTIHAARPLAREKFREDACMPQLFRRGKSPFARRKRRSD